MAESDEVGHAAAEQAVDQVAGAPGDSDSARGRKHRVNRAPRAEAHDQREDHEPDHDRDHPTGSQETDPDPRILDMLHRQRPDKMPDGPERQPTDQILRRPVGEDTARDDEQEPAPLTSPRPDRRGHLRGQGGWAWHARVIDGSARTLERASPSRIADEFLPERQPISSSARRPARPSSRRWRKWERSATRSDGWVV